MLLTYRVFGMARALVGCLSRYAQELGGERLENYLRKLKNLGLFFDPYCRSTKWKKAQFGSDLGWTLSYCDIYLYICNTTSQYTRESLKAFKSLEAYKWAVAPGFIQDVEMAERKDKVLFKAKVSHSQSLSKESLVTWVVLERSGNIMASHCTCMAGLSQTCSHAAALLFLLFLHVEEENTPCTSKKCKWSETKVAKYSKISNVDFRSPSAKFLGKETGKVSHEIFDQPTEAEKKRFLQKLHSSCNDTGYKPVAFAVMKEFAEEYLPLLSSGLLPCLITDYYSPSYLSLSYNEVVVLAESITHSIKLSSEQCTMAERHTRSQADSKIWYRLRAGRVTGSRFKQACSTKVESPAISLIEAVCYPEAVKFSSKSTMYGRLNEKNGLRCFISVEEGKHSNFCVGASGLWFHPDFPQFAVSPDAVGKCSCHGKFSVEIKCPFRAENQKLSELVGTKSFFLDEVNGSIIRLKKDSPHYYQVQMQLAILEAEFCFFVVRSPLELYIETIIRDKVFFNIMATKATRFWTNCILPETIAKTFTAATTHAVQYHPTMFLAPPEEEDDVIEVD